MHYLPCAPRERRSSSLHIELSTLSKCLYFRILYFSVFQKSAAFRVDFSFSNFFVLQSKFCWYLFLLCVGVRCPYWQIRSKKFLLNQSFVVLLHKTASPCLPKQTFGPWAFTHSTVCTSHSFPHSFVLYLFSNLHNKSPFVMALPRTSFQLPGFCHEASARVSSRLGPYSLAWASWMRGETKPTVIIKLHLSTLKPHTFVMFRLTFTLYSVPRVGVWLLPRAKQAQKLTKYKVFSLKILGCYASLFILTCGVKQHTTKLENKGPQTTIPKQHCEASHLWQISVASNRGVHCHSAAQWSRVKKTPAVTLNRFACGG